MSFTLNAHLRSHGKFGYVAWIDKPTSLKMLVHADTPESAAKELLLSLKVTLSHKLGININTIIHKEICDDEEVIYRDLSKGLREKGEKELKLQFA